MKMSLPAAALAALVSAPAVAATPEEDRAVIAALDVRYQEAVKRNDVETMGRILANDFILVLGNGTVISRRQLLDQAASGALVYELQDEVPGTQTVRVWGDTATVTALLQLRGSDAGRRFDYRLWFTDTYVRMPTGWRYVFGQASLPLPGQTATAGER